EVVAAVGRRTDHDVVALEEREGVAHRLRGKMGAVAIHGDHAPAPGPADDLERGFETGREPVTVLRDRLDAEPARELVLVTGGAHDGDSRHADGTYERERVLDEAAVDRDDVLRRERGCEAGLYLPGTRRLRHDDERARPQRVSGNRCGRRPDRTTPPRRPHAAPMLPRSVPLIFEWPRRGW